MQRGHTIRPLERVEDSQEPWVFLAGPIQGAADWQAYAIGILHDIDPRLNIANPRTTDPWHGNYRGQVQWESYYLRLAALTGCILFWGAAEAEHTCGRAFGQTTRFELGEWFAIHQFVHCQLVVGTHPSFSGKHYIQERYLRAPAEIDGIHVTLEGACSETATRARMHCERGKVRRTILPDDPLQLSWYASQLNSQCG